MAKNWKLKSNVPRELLPQLRGYPALAAQLLYTRGLVEKTDIEGFMNPKYENLHNPFLFHDMEKAVERIWWAINHNEKICIYGDYDADAVTANAVLQQTFRYLGALVESYVPDRFTEGYGVNLEALSKIKDKASAVIITVDCGTNSVDAANFCRQNNIDLIITDHHEIIGEVPNSYALINPKNPADAYPYHEIVGVGVAFKLACGILSKHELVTERLVELSSRNFLLTASSVTENKSNDDGKTLIRNSVVLPLQPQQPYTGGWEKWLLDLVAIGTVADCHSLIGENRILVKYGLTVLKKTKWAGLRALAQTAGLDFVKQPPDTYTLGFVIAPRLNAAGRLEHANIALDLLLEHDPVQARSRAEQLESINKRRQDQTQRILSEAKDEVLKIQDRKVLIVAGEGWNKGVVGLVAGRLVEEYHKPTMVLAREGAEATGSARTVGGFDLVESLKYASVHLTRFGGHKQAAGLTLRTAEFEQFYQKVLDFAETNLSEEDLEYVLSLEAELNGDLLSPDTAQLIQSLEPFGVHNPRPKFLIKNAAVLSSRCVGSGQQHLQMKLDIGGKEIDGIMFNCSDFAKNLEFGEKVDLAAELIEDNWNGRKRLKLRIIDLRKII